MIEYFKDTLMGKRIYINDIRVPNMMVSAAFARIQSEELVHETQQWMNGFFGVSWMIPTGTVMASDTMLVMNPETYKQLKEKVGV